MEISTKKKLIFMHTPRTAGGTIVTSLRPLWTKKTNKNKLAKLTTRLGFTTNPERVRFRAHTALATVQKRLGNQTFNEYFKIAFVRNPYSWLTSLYSTLKRGPNHRHHPIVSAMSGFPEYVDWEIARNQRNQRQFLIDKDGKLAIDFVGRFENLHADYMRLCAAIHYDGPAELPHINQNRFTDYEEFYDDETREKVADFWASDIELIGYDFEGTRLDCPLDELASNQKHIGVLKEAAA